ncbi:MAG TPA: hypothetical protein VNG93_04240 [Candidatus Dormibacteraeota bacterium]|nr:hypothetical protein [Candidatus Dormibacteraeota bacterium]
MAAEPEFDRRRTYAEWYVWSARNLTSTVEIRHACAEAATTALSSGGDPAAAARAAAQNRSGPGWTTRAEPGIRSYAEWYDWARNTLTLSGEPLHTAAAAAIGAMEAGGDAAAASDAARRTLTEVTAAPHAGSGTWAPPPPASPAAIQPPPAPPPLAPVLPPPAPIPSPPPPANPVQSPSGQGPDHPPGGYVVAPPPAFPDPGQAYPDRPAPVQPGPVPVPVWATVLLGFGCGISLLLALVYAVVLTDRTDSQDIVVGSILFGGIGLVMFVCSLVALIGIIRKASWGRMMAIIAGAAFCLSCVGILLGVPVIIGAATSQRRPDGVY